jgi:protease-4
MKKFLVVLLCLIGGMTVLLVGVTVLFWILGLATGPSISQRTVLQVNLEIPFIENIPEDPVASFTLRGTPTVREFVQALNRAGRDPRVQGLVARVGAGGHGMAVTQELRDAVQRFRDTGKFAVAYSETFGDNGPGNGGYYLATAFDEIYLLPSGDVGLTGLMLEHPFVKGTFDLLGITPRLDQRHEYKNAMNFYTHTEFTEAHEESMRRLLGSWFDQMVDGIAGARGMSPDEVRALVDAGPHYGQEAVDNGLVDGLAYRDEVYRKIEDRVKGAVNYLYLDDYLERSGSFLSGPTVALIYGQGTVLRGKSHYAALSGEMIMGADTVSRAFRDAVDDSRVEAIIFRVNSPGGSYPASDAIHRETVRAREAGKPVIVSMGNYAASGGYFVALDADKIVAQPGTLTASIGVLGGKLINRDMWKKIGMTFDEVHTSRNATIWSSLEDYSDEEWERFQAWLDRVYEDFTGRVAAGRELPLEEVLEIAKGRVWTGEDALEHGLVDELGGLHRAVELAKEAVGIDPDSSVRLKLFPRKRSTLEMFLDMESSLYGSNAAAEAMGQTLREVQPYGRLTAETLGGPARHGVLTVPVLYYLPQ